MDGSRESILSVGADDVDVAPYIHANAPFGPVASEQIDDRLFQEKLFDRENRAYSHLIRRDPAFIVGRRGAGKTAFLYALTADEPTLNVKINTSTVVAEIEDLLRILSEVGTTLFVEHVSELWGAALWHGILTSLVQNRPDSIDEHDDRFETIRVYLDDLSMDAALHISGEEAMGLFCAEFIDAAADRPMMARHPNLFALNGVSLASVIESAGQLLAEADVQAVLLMDSIEDFQDVLDYHTRAIEGLFMQVGRSAQARAAYRIRFSLPAELWHVLRSMSRNPLKDFGQFIVLHWSAREIVKIAAHRYMLYLDHYHRSFLGKNPDIARLNTDSERQALQLLRTVLPPTVKGEIGVEEDTVAYVLRHTQLLPRHLLRLLNAVWVRNNDGLNGVDSVQVGEEAVIKGVCDVEGHIVTEICKAYELVHPMADEVCRAVLKNLPRRFSDSELHKAFNRVGKGAIKRASRRMEDRRLAERSDRIGTIDNGMFDMDYFDFRAMLLEIGCLGRQIDQTERYDVAEFEYAIPHRLAVGDDDVMCVHPLFSGVYQSQPDPEGEKRLVYPYGSDPIDDHRSGDQL